MRVPLPSTVFIHWEQYQHGDGHSLDFTNADQHDEQRGVPEAAERVEAPPLLLQPSMQPALRAL